MLSGLKSTVVGLAAACAVLSRCGDAASVLLQVDLDNGQVVSGGQDKVYVEDLIEMQNSVKQLRTAFVEASSNYITTLSQKHDMKCADPGACVVFFEAMYDRHNLWDPVLSGYQVPVDGTYSLHFSVYTNDVVMTGEALGNSRGFVGISAGVRKKGSDTVQWQKTQHYEVGERNNVDLVTHEFYDRVDANEGDLLHFGVSVNTEAMKSVYLIHTMGKQYGKATVASVDRNV